MRKILKLSGLLVFIFLCFCVIFFLNRPTKKEKIHHFQKFYEENFAQKANLFSGKLPEKELTTFEKSVEVKEVVEKKDTTGAKPKKKLQKKRKEDNKIPVKPDGVQNVYNGDIVTFKTLQRGVVGGIFVDKGTKLKGIIAFRRNRAIIAITSVILGDTPHEILLEVVDVSLTPGIIIPELENFVIDESTDFLAKKIERALGSIHPLVKEVAAIGNQLRKKKKKKKKIRLSPKMKVYVRLPKKRN